jgi:hypothetical protein
MKSERECEMLDPQDEKAVMPAPKKKWRKPDPRLWCGRTIAKTRREKEKAEILRSAQNDRIDN